MRRTAAVLSILVFAFWYSNSGGLYLVAAMILGGAALGIFGLITETMGWLLVAMGGIIAYDGYMGVGIFMMLVGIVSIKMAQKHGLLYDIVFVSIFNLDVGDDA